MAQLHSQHFPLHLHCYHVLERAENLQISRIWIGPKTRLPSCQVAATNFGVILSPHSIREMKDTFEDEVDAYGRKSSSEPEDCDDADATHTTCDLLATVLRSGVELMETRIGGAAEHELAP